jgi:uncharacterized protein YndB with AHSA1/START domain
MSMGRLLILILIAGAIAYFVPAPVTHFDSALEIEASRERVWEMLSDLSQISRWNEDVDSAVFVGPQHDGEGAEVRVDGSMFTSALRVTRWEPYNRIDFAVLLKPRLTWDHVLRYSMQRRFENRTIVRVEEEYRMAGGYLGHVFGILIFERMRDPYRVQALSYLKRLAETGVGLGT